MPDILELGEVILEREFEALKSDGRSSRVLVKIAKPTFNPKDDWECRFQIIGIGNEKIRHTAGVDSLHALLFTIGMIEELIHYWERVEKTKITWLGMDDLGLKTPDGDKP